MRGFTKYIVGFDCYNSSDITIQELHFCPTFIIRVRDYYIIVTDTSTLQSINEVYWSHGMFCLPRTLYIEKVFCNLLWDEFSFVTYIKFSLG